MRLNYNKFEIGEKGNIIIWSVITEESIKTIIEPKSHVFSLIKLNDSQITSGDISLIKIWCLVIGNCLRL